MTKHVRTFIHFVIALLFVPIIVNAANFQGGEEYVLPQGQNITDDLYTAGGSVTILGNINGDLVTAGGDVTINGEVSQDLIAAGGSVQVLKKIGDDARLAGGQISVREQIGGDLVAAGGRIEIFPESQIARDVSLAAGEIVFNGTSNGNLKVGGGKVTINGTVEGNVDIQAEEVHIGSNAVIRGYFHYTAKEQANIQQGAQILGQTEFTPQTSRGAGFGPLAFLLPFFAQGLMLMLLGILVVFVFRKFSFTLATQTVNNFGKEALLGLAILFLFPVVMVLFFVTVVGIPVGFFLLLVYLLLLFIAWIYTGVVAGGMLSKWFQKEIKVNWKWVIAGVIALQLIMLIPFIGWFVAFVFFIATLGTLGHLIYQHFWVQRNT